MKAVRSTGDLATKVVVDDVDEPPGIGEVIEVRTASICSSDLLASRPEVADTRITHRFPLDAAVEAFRVASDRSTGAIRVVLET